MSSVIKCLYYILTKCLKADAFKIFLLLLVVCSEREETFACYLCLLQVLSISFKASWL